MANNGDEAYKMKSLVEQGIQPIKKPKQILKELKIDIPENKTFVVLDPGTRNCKYASTDDQHGCFPTLVGTAINDSARRLIGGNYGIGRVAEKNHFGRFVEKNDAEKMIFNNGVIITENNDLPDHIKNKSIALLEYVLGQAVVENAKEKEVWLTIAVPPETGMDKLPHYIAVVRSYNEKRDAESKKRSLPYVKGLLVRSQPELLAKSLADGYGAAFQIGAGTISGEVSYGIDKEGELPSVTVNGAGEWADEELLHRLQQKNKYEKIELADVRTAKENFGYVGQTKNSAVLELGAGRRKTKLDITKDLGEVCELLVTKLVSEAILPLFEKVPKEIQEEVAKNTYIGGGGSGLIGLAECVNERVKPTFPTVNCKIIPDRFFGECIYSFGYVTSAHARPQYITEL